MTDLDNTDNHYSCVFTRSSGRRPVITLPASTPPQKDGT